MRSALHNIASWLPHRARISGTRCAVVDAERRLDYASLDSRCAQLAGALRSAGIGPGDRVALLLENRSAYVEATFAAARLGAIAVPLNNHLAPPELRYVLEDSAPRALFVEERLEEKLRATGLAPPPYRIVFGRGHDAYESTLAEARPCFDVTPALPEDPVILMYTSGTTGVPKGALLPHRKSLYNCLNAQLFFELTARDRVLVALPLFHSFGLQILSIPTLYAGGTVYLQRRFDPEGMWRAVMQEGISFFGGVPTMFRALLDVLERQPDRFDLASLRFLFTAGAAIAVETVEAYERSGLRLKQGFGQTETSILCCLDAEDAVRKAGSVGRPVFHSEVRVVERQSLQGPPVSWRETPDGETGEIVVHGPITMLGYWNQPEETARVLQDGWLRTGDLATRDPEGFITLAGRERELYISGGENVYPAEVESAYSEHPAIREIAVVGVPDRRWGEVGQAFVVLADGETLDPEALSAWGYERLAGFKVPKRWIQASQLPRNAGGKVQKFRLREAAESQP